MDRETIEAIWTTTRILIAAGIGFAFFLLIRSFVLWYWRINDVANAIQSIADDLTYFRKKSEADAAVKRSDASLP